MTVCIAAHAVDHTAGAIVLCFDLMVGDDFSTSETEFKCEVYFGEGLMAMKSGSVADAQDLIRLYKKRLGSRSLSLRDLQEELRIGMKDFKSDLARIGRKPKHDVQLLVCGFVEGEGVILHIDCEEIAHVNPSYWTIGSGAWTANTMLRWRFARDYLSPFHNINEVIYWVYEAKRFGELSPSVGTQTEMLVISPSPVGHLQVNFLSPEHLEFLAGEFEEYGPRRLPQGINAFERLTLRVPPDPQPTTADSSHLPPSPESPGGSDES